MVISRLVALLIPILLSANSTDFQQFKNKQNKNFTQSKQKFIDYKKVQDKAFNEYLKKETKAVAEYRKKVKALWPKTDLNNAKKFVNYSKDLHIKTLIDFKNNEIVISEITSNKKLAEKNLFNALKKTVRLSTKEAYTKNPLEQTVAKISKNSNFILASRLDNQKLLKTPFSKHEINKIKIIKKRGFYELRYKLPKNSTFHRSLNYLIDAKSNAQRFKLKAQWLLAIMHTESSFNPLARSWVPAYGLMQIVPKTAGIDAYYFLYKKRRFLSASYLYNTHNNIEIGSAYFYILYYKYLASIKNPTSRLYCAIASYNTGAGNIARAFIGTNNVKKASIKINKLSANEVYAYLLKNLKYDEPKEYLKKVRRRSEKYKTVYHL